MYNHSEIPPFDDGSTPINAEFSAEPTTPGRDYPNGSPTYTTSTSVPGDRPWTGAVHPSVAESLNQDAIKNVQHLIELNVDSAKGWEAAANAVDTASLKGRFSEIAGQRRGFAEELQGLVRRAGETPESSGTMSGSLHRWWMNLRASVGSANTRTILEESERGEDVIKHGYEDALKQGSLGGLSRMVGDQAVNVRRVHDEVKTLRDQWRSRD
jgi:uncharacterized protein (TIGR02284 family)